jgi:2,3-bisphosphoglycerate-dependent phosphoglycerate mutase
MEMFQKRWADMTYSESDGECLKDVQDRNIEVISAILDEHEGESILLGTHGTALSTIMNYYDKSFGLEGFLRIIDYLPYVVRLGFEGHKLVEKEELLIIEKVFNG